MYKTGSQIIKFIPRYTLFSHETSRLLPSASPRVIEAAYPRAGPHEIMRVKKGGKGKAVAKSDLPTKTCVVCNRPFTW